MIAAGDRVTVHYITRSLEGSVIESTRPRHPLTFVAGSGEVIPGLSRGVIGLQPGDRKTITVSPENGFGNRSPELLQPVPLSALPEDLSSGDQLKMTFDDEEVDVWVHRVMANEAQIDANHPLAGETLIIDVEVLDAG
ncbi:MAG: peptidylprolyl isomerase [Planctomycetaceae bacterium]